MKKSALLVALSAASLVGSVALAQAQTKPYSDTKPEATKPSMDSSSSAGPNLAQMDKNNDGVVDKQEAKALAAVSSNFDKADTNKDGKLDSAEFSAAAPMFKAK
jgi:K+-transporting ATPase c subunit